MLFRLLGLEGTQGLAQGVGEFADRGLDDVELGDLGVRIEHQVAQRLVVAAELGAKRGEQLLVELQRILGKGGDIGRGRRQVFYRAGFAGEKAPKFAHRRDPLNAPIRPAVATPNHMKNQFCLNLERLG